MSSYKAKLILNEAGKMEKDTDNMRMGRIN